MLQVVLKHGLDHSASWA